MPSTKSPRRVTKKAVAPRSTKRRSLKARLAASPAPAAPDALLVAEFAEALGHSPRKPSRTRRRTLADALRQASQADDVLAAMPGARIAQPSLDEAAQLELAPPPCLAAVRRRRAIGKVSGAASWCVAFVVTAGIVSAAAYGIASQAPVKSAQPITTANAAQF